MDNRLPGRVTHGTAISRVRHDLREGSAGWPIRLGLSVGGLAALLGVLFVFFGILEATDVRIADQITAIGLATVGVCWCVFLVLIWRGYRKWQRTLNTLFYVCGIWIVVVPVCVLIEGVFNREEFLIAGVILLGVASTIAVVSTAIYQALGGRPMYDGAGSVTVKCPGCGYSLVGLSSSGCPECGWEGTIDELIRLQDFAEVRSAEYSAIQPGALPPGSAERV